MNKQEIQRTLDWYCRDCECNGRCEDTKCYFYRQFERYLNGDDDALPPDNIFADYRYKRFVSQMMRNLEHYVDMSDFETVPRAYAFIKAPEYRSIRRGTMDDMLGKVKEELELLLKK